MRAVQGHLLPGYLGVVAVDSSGTIAHIRLDVQRFGLSADLIGTNIVSLIHPDEVGQVMASFSAVSERAGHHQALAMRLTNGLSIEVVADNQLDNPRVGLIVYSVADPGDRRRSSRLLEAQGDVLRQMASGAGADAAIAQVLDFLEIGLPGCRAAAYVPTELLAGGTCPSIGSALACLTSCQLKPDLGQAMAKALSRQPELPGALALAGAEVVIAADLNLPQWSQAKQLLGAESSCVWSVPIRHERGAPAQGLIEVYGPDPAHPRDDEWSILHLAGRMAATAIDHDRLQHQLRRDARVDPLTTVPNRRVLTERLDRALSRPGGRPIVCFIDLDRLKIVNDGLGHEAGDQVIREAARRLTRAVGPTGLVGRFGGDEFVAIVESGAGPSTQGTHRAAWTAPEVASRCLEAFREPFDVGGRSWQLSASIGVVEPVGRTTSTEVLRDADAAMYEAKRAGRACWRLFDSATRDQAMRRMRLEAALREAMSAGQVTAHFQAVAHARTWQPVGAEALARWQLGDGSWVPPAEFVPLAEEIGLIDELGGQVLRRAAQALQRLAELDRPGWIAVNFSALQLQSEAFFESLSTLDEAVRARICLEMTEQHLVDESSLTLKRIHRLVGHGVGLAVDDFGTGYSSLGALHRLPAKTLKIDRRLSSRVGTPSGDAVLAAAVGVARAYQLDTVAEGVETVEQARLLRELDVDYMQGFLFSRPEPLEELLQRLERPWPWDVPEADLTG
ncbi:MAG: putative bifunctional diguanylate cyclase/phosphodiesterase [Actinomycetales bacterium]